MVHGTNRGQSILQPGIIVDDAAVSSDCAVVSQAGLCAFATLV